MTGNLAASPMPAWLISHSRCPSAPERCLHMLGQMLQTAGPDRILWGTDSIWNGSPQSQIERMRRITMSEKLMKKYGYPVPASTKTVAAKAPAPKAKAKAPAAKTPKKTYVAPTRRALKQHQAKQKAARKAAAAAAVPTAPAAEAPVQG